MGDFRLKEHYDRATDDAGTPTGQLIDFAGHLFRSGPPMKHCDADTVTLMALHGANSFDIAAELGVSESTISAKYGNAYKQGRAYLKRLLSMKQIDMALAGNVVMLKWLGQHILGQDETIKIQTSVRNDALELSVDELKEQYKGFQDGKQEEQTCY